MPDGDAPRGGFRLRDFRPEDQAVVRAVVLAGLRERWGDAFDAGFNPDLDDLQATYVARGAEVIVVESDGLVVATGTLLPEDRRAGRLLRMSVDARFRRQGLGRRIVGELAARARTRGLTELRVMTDTPWTSAVELYRSCGFTPVLDDGTDTHFVLLL